MSQVISASVVWWSFFAMWQGLMSPGLQEDRKIESRPAALARAAQRI